MLAIDLCAGIGWTVACQRLGISELGIEIMPEAIATRDAMGALTQTYVDEAGRRQGVSLSDLPDDFCRQAPLQIAGPPCQTFSAAGSGEGRRALPEVLRRAKHLGATGDLIRGGAGDPRTWLVLEPLRLALWGLPLLIVWEQVPSVLPVWQLAGEILRAVGYSVWTGCLNSEQYGVPQTRKRAFLIARRDGKMAAPPVPTHSRYHNRTPEKLDPGVLPWVSMAQALGWGVTGRPSFTVTGGGSATGGAEQFGRAARDSLLAYRSSTMPNATFRTRDQPAPTIAFGNDAKSVGWVQRSNYTGRGADSVPSPVPGSPNLGARAVDRPSATVTSKGHHWVNNRPATTVQGDPRIAAAGHHERQMNNSIRVTVEEAAALQTFPCPELIQGTAGKRYLQVGNMVPPLLGEAILRTFL